MKSDPNSRIACVGNDGVLSQARRFSLTSTTSPGESIASSGAWKKDQKDSVADAAYPDYIFGIIGVVSRCSSFHFQQPTRRSDARLDFTQALGRVLELVRVCRP